MRTKVVMLLTAGLFLLPALAQADIYNRSTLGRSRSDWSLRKLIAKKLNQMPSNQVGRSARAKFLPSKIRGTKSLHPGVFGTQISVNFQAQPRMRVKVNGRRQTVYLGGCAGNCGVLRPIQGRDRITSININALLRSLPRPALP